MGRSFLSLILLIVAGPALAAPSPRLIVFVVGDQVRADYLERYHAELSTGGLRRFRDQGAYFTQAVIDHAVTKTSPGHVLFGSGLSPARSGIVNNDWYDPGLHRAVSPVELGKRSGRVELPWFTGTSFAQRLHAARPGSRVVSVSLKDRAALLFTGPDQDDAYWWDNKDNRFTAYRQPPPAWLIPFTKRARGLGWKDRSDGLIEALAESAFQEWKLGRSTQGDPDVLTVSFSAVDLVGHRFGPDSKEVKAALLRLDQAVARLFDFLDQAGVQYVAVFSSDHGVTPVPETAKARGLPAGRVILNTKNLASGKSIEAISVPFVYLSDPKALEEVRSELQMTEGVAKVYSEADVRSAKVPPAVSKSFYLPRSGESRRCGDLMVILRPGYIFSKYSFGTTHGQPTTDDQRVPLGFYGAGVRARVSNQPLSPGVAAPTLLKLLGIPAPDLAIPIDIF